MKDLSIQFEGWDSVTDVACTACGKGLLRWAENGFVPGYRICDHCGRHWALIHATNSLKPNGRRYNKKEIKSFFGCV